MANFTLTELKAELDTDPAGIGYAGLGWPSSGDQEIADALNNPAFTVNHTEVSTKDMKAQTPFDALDGLAASEESYYTWLTGGETISVTTELLQDWAGVGGTSRWAVADRSLMEPRMVALMQFTGSRAEVLWGEGTSVSASQVGAAANV